MPPEDDVFPPEEQPLLVAATPTADSPGYIPEFDPNGDLEEDDEEDPEEDPADYPVDFTVVALPAVDHVPSKEVTKPLPRIPSSPLPIPSPPPDIPTHIEILESCLPLQKRLRFASPTRGRKSSAAGAARQDEPAVARDDPYSLVREELYGFFDSEPARRLHQPPYMGVNQRVTDLSTIVEQETNIMYGMMEEAQDDRSQLRGRVNLLYKDRPVHHRLAVMIETEARMAREAWGLSMNASDNAHADVMSLRTTLVARHALILDLQAADRRRHGVIKELLAADHKRQRQNTGRAYAAGNGERKEYVGTLPLCNKCKFHHNGQCTIKCVNCKRVGHLTRDCRSPAATNNHRNPTCYECRNQGQYRSDCPELKNQDHGNQAGGTGAHGMVHALEGGETNQDLNDVEDDINA
nr:hypothetical protein [Tanacetum cinerariifolium]